ncbi:MBOAT family protein, partial [Aliarcobacter butzleri]
PINFNSPYKALSIQDFWRRWHMTLSRFLRDYLYIPLGGNRKGSIRTYVNLITTFLLGGLWHGAGWTFIIWGLLHGIALAIHRLWQSLGFRMNKILAWFITFNFINITWIFFRAKDFESAMKVLSSMFSFDNVVLPSIFFKKLAFLENYGIKFDEVTRSISGGSDLLNLTLASMIIVFFFKNSMQLKDKFKSNIFILFFTVFLFVYSMFSLNKFSEFLYFNF